MFEPAEGIDYLFNRYAFLGIPQTASQDEIEKAIKKIRVENHPDILMRASEAVKQAAEAQLHYLPACEFLLNPAWRTNFDIILAAFQNNKPNAISKSGHPIIDLTAPYVNIKVLLGGQPDDMSGFLQQAEQMSGYSPALVAKLRKMAALDPTDADLQSLLKEALEAELTYVQFVEEAALAEIGMGNANTFVSDAKLLPSQYAETFEAKVDTFVTEMVPEYINAAVTSSSLLLEGPHTRLLAGPLKTKLKQSPAEEMVGALTQTIADLTAKASEVIAAKREKLKDIATRKQALLEEIAAAEPLIWLTPMPLRQGLCDIFLLNSRHKEEDAQHVLIAFRVDDNTMRLTGFNGDDIIGLSLTELKQRPFDHDAVAVHFNGELGFPLATVEGAITQRRRLLGLPD